MKATLKILVVEDHPDTRKFMVMYLRGFGHSVIEAATVEAARQALDRENFDVMISDIGLPDGTGWDVMENAPPGSITFAIAMSGFGRDIDREKSEAVGFHHHLLKPFAPEAIDRLLEEFASTR